MRFAITIISALAITKTVCFAGGLQSLKLYTGTINLINDATTAFMVILPIACGLCILIFQLIKGAADQNEQQIWAKRTKVAIIACAIGMGASGIVNLLVSYYGG